MKTLQQIYGTFRKAGFLASQALHSAKAVIDWEPLEDAGLVRLRAEPEQESYFDVYGELEGYEGANGRRVSAEQERKELIDTIDRDGCWCIVAEYFDGQKWRHADSIGMCTGYKNPLSPVENAYVSDLMRSTISQIPQPGDH